MGFLTVNADRLAQKLEAKGVRGVLLAVVKSWLRTRTARVVVEGSLSQEAALDNQVFQGTVLGPPLWNTFFEDGRRAVNGTGFQEGVVADDCNCYKSYHRTCCNEVLHEEMAACQTALPGSYF